MHTGPKQPLQLPVEYLTVKTLSRLSPTEQVLSASAAGVLKDHYVQIRQTLVGAGREDNDPDAREYRLEQSHISSSEAHVINCDSAPHLTFSVALRCRIVS